MDSTILPLQSGSFWISVAIVAVFIAAVSAFFQIQSQEGAAELNKKTLLRDGMLGAIVGALGWIMAPESMEKVSSSLVQTMEAGGAGDAIAKHVSFELPDVHIGSPDF
jgi:Mn2+/Fe2+ NRAMP family transporter